MLGDLLMGGIISELLPFATGSTDEAGLSGQFASVMVKYFGVESAEIVQKSVDVSSAEEYVFNTRKPLLDNQLSEYSAFPALIQYRNDGYRSCAMFPVLCGGRVLSILRLLSKQENKFTDEMAKSIEMVVSFFAFSFAYKSESSKNARLVEYFDAAFDSNVPQFLVSKDGVIVKSNKSAMRAFGIAGQKPTPFKDIFGIDFQSVEGLGQKGVEASIRSRDAYDTYRITARKVNSNLAHIIALNVTGNSVMDSLLLSLSQSRDLYMVVTDPNLSILDTSSNFEGMLKYSGSLLSGKRLTDFMKGGDSKALESAAKEYKAPVTLSLNLMTEGFVMPVKAVLSRLPFGYLVAIVTAEAESYVKEAKENISNFIESTSDIAIKLDGYCYIKECNLPVETALGYTKDELIGREARNLYKDEKVFDRDISYVRNGGKIDNSYVDMIKKDSDILSGMQSVRLLRGSREEEGYLVIIKELETKRRLSDLESELHEKESQVSRLKSETTQKSEFIYDITHELKTPLTNIKGFSSLLSEGQAGDLTEGQKEYVSTIIEEADRLVLIIQQVLDAAKLEAAKVKLDFKDVDLRTMADNPAIRSLEESARQKGLAFEWNADYDLPSVSADPNRLLQVFVNLIGNAIKFTENGGVSVRVFRKSRTRIECSVSDTGIGISEEDRKKLFKKFYQAQKKGLARQDGAGTGLGLAITKAIIGLHSGRIGVESTVGEGSRFWFQIPIKRPRRRKS